MIKSIKILNEASFKEEVMIENLQKVRTQLGQYSLGAAIGNKSLD